jgi:hypothetical protein
MMNIKGILKVGGAHPTCLDMMPPVFRGSPSSSEKSLVAQAKASGYTKLNLNPAPIKGVGRGV